MKVYFQISFYRFTLNIYTFFIACGSGNIETINLLIEKYITEIGNLIFLLIKFTLSLHILVQKTKMILKS